MIDHQVTGDARFGRHEGHRLVMLARTRANLLAFHCTACDEPVALTLAGGQVTGVAHKVVDACPGCGCPVRRWEVCEPGHCDECREALVRAMIAD